MILTEIWETAGKFHRHDGPAVLYRCLDSGVVSEEGWWLNGKPHREDGPCRYWA